MNYQEPDQAKLELLHHVDEISSDYDSDRDDLPMFEAKHMRQSTLHRALKYSEVLIAKGESLCLATIVSCAGVCSDCFPPVNLLLPTSAKTKKWTTIQSRKSYTIVGICLALLAFFGLVFGPRQSFSTPTETAVATTLPLTYNRILSASMLFGITSPTYKRAIKTHKRQAQRWGYGTEILQRDEGCGFWIKLIFLLNLVGQEMQKPADTRAEWIM